MKNTFKILRCLRRRIFRVCLDDFQDYAWKGKSFTRKNLLPLLFGTLNLFEKQNTVQLQFYFSLS